MDAATFAHLSCSWATCEAITPYGYRHLVAPNYLDPDAFLELDLSISTERGTLAALAEEFLSPVVETIMTNLFDSSKLDDSLVTSFYRCVGVGRDADDGPTPTDRFSLRAAELRQRDRFYTRHLGYATTPTPASSTGSLVPSSCLAYRYLSGDHHIRYTFTGRSPFLMHYLRSFRESPDADGMGDR
jgi:hypothetical protein